MMNTTTAAVGTGAIVVAGRWAAGFKIDIQIGVGIGVYAVALSMLSSTNALLGSQVAILVLFAAMAVYLEPLLIKMGLIAGTGVESGQNAPNSGNPPR